MRPRQFALLMERATWRRREPRGNPDVWWMLLNGFGARVFDHGDHHTYWTVGRPIDTLDSGEPSYDVIDDGICNGVSAAKAAAERFIISGDAKRAQDDDLVYIGNEAHLFGQLKDKLVPPPSVDESKAVWRSVIREPNIVKWTIINGFAACVYIYRNPLAKIRWRVGKAGEYHPDGSPKIIDDIMDGVEPNEQLAKSRAETFIISGDAAEVHDDMVGDVDDVDPPEV